MILDSVGILDSRQSGTILYVDVKVSGLYRPQVEQNLGQIIIDAFNAGAQKDFTSALGNNYFSGVIGVFLSLKKNESRPAPPVPPPTFSPTLPPDMLPSTPVEPPAPATTNESSSSQPPTVSTSLTPTEPDSPDTPSYYLALLIQNTPYQTRYMEDTDFDKFVEVLKGTVNAKMEDSTTVIKGVTLGYHQLISLGNRITATEINFEYKVSTSLPKSEVGQKVARTIGRNRQYILSSLLDQSDSFPYFLEIKEIQAQNIASIGEPSSKATLPKNVPEKPKTQPPTPSPTFPPTPLKVEEKEPEAVEEDLGITVADLLASDAAKAQAAKDEAKENANNVNRNETDAVGVKAKAIVDSNETGETGGLGIGGELFVLFTFYALLE